MRDDLAAFGQESNRISFHRNSAAESLSMRRGSVRQAMAAKNVNRSSVASTIAELRRMNSTLSTYSHTSSHAGDGGSPTLPILRGGGFSPAHRTNAGLQELSLRWQQLSEKKLGGDRIVYHRQPRLGLTALLGKRDLETRGRRGYSTEETGACSTWLRMWEEPSENKAVVELKMPKLDVA